MKNISKPLVFFENRSRLFVKEIGTGNMNYVFQVEEKESGKKLILKQAVPYARCVGGEFPHEPG